MSKDKSLRKQAIDRLFAEMGGKHSTDEFTDALLSMGLLDDSPEAVRQLMVDQTRKLLEGNRSMKIRRGEIGDAWLNFPDVDEQGNPIRSWLKGKDMTISQALARMGDWDVRMKDIKDKALVEHSYFAMKHGRTYLRKREQQLQMFDEENRDNAG